MSSLAASQIVVILGAGPGSGFSIAKAFASQGHPVALLSRSLDVLQAQAKEIKKLYKDESRARAYSADATNEQTIADAFKQIQKDFTGKYIHTGVFNPTGGFHMAPWDKTDIANLRAALDTQVVGAFAFSKSFLDAVRSRSDWKTPPEPSAASANLFFTGATASLKGGTMTSAFSPAKFGVRSLSQSLAREFGPQNIHVAHFVLDGIFDTERVQGILGGDFPEDTRVNVDHMAQVYVDVARQKRTAWSQEVDLRPFAEKF